MIGRTAELGAIDRWVADDGAALVLEGEPGIGKTTLWEAAVDRSRARGRRVLATRASGAEAQLSFAALTDLLDELEDEAFTALPAPQRHALDVALLRAAPDGAVPDARSIAQGLLTLLRTLARRTPLTLAVDDLQSLDVASAEILAFVVRRLGDARVSVLLARRPGAVTELERAVALHVREHVLVRPFGMSETARLLLEQLELNVRRPLLRRIVEATGGNPLFALELGRTLARHGPPASGEELPLPEGVEGLLGTRIASSPPALRRLLLAVALSGDLRSGRLAALDRDDALDSAVEAGLLVFERGHVRPAHPLLAAVAVAQASAVERRELHAELAEAADDEELRAFHLALATEQPDDRLAATVEAAAATAAARGAAQEAVILAEHALRLTSAAEDQDRRLLVLANYLDVAGEQVRLTELLAPRLESLPAGAARAKAALLLSSGALERNDEVVGFLERALAESTDEPQLRAAALADLASNDVVARVARIEEAEERASKAADIAAEPEVVRSALYALAWARALRGKAVDGLLLRTPGSSHGVRHLAVERVAAQRLVWRGQIAEARRELARLAAEADERGEPISYALQRLHLIELEIRCGGWDEATRLLDEWARDGELFAWPCYDRARALVAAGRGLLEDAEGWAADAVERAERTGIQWDRLEALRARGVAALLAGDLPRAHESLATVWEHLEREGVAEPGVFPVAAELVEALAELSRLDAARAVTSRLRELADDHPWATVTARRCQALVRLAENGADIEAGEELEAAAADYGDLGLPFDRARSLLSLGRAQRRVRKWGAARESLEEAAAAFDELGSPGWAEAARAELSRVGGRRAAPAGELTEMEQRVAALAADGLANKEIARTLFVSVRTVEVHLKHAYAKLGIRSRTQLTHYLSA